MHIHLILEVKMLGLFKKKDPICGMKEEKDKGIKKYGNWFCSNSCLNKYEKNMNNHSHKGCCP